MKIDLFLNTNSAGIPIKADLYPDEGIELKRKIFGEDGLENTNANFTKDFMLPATDRNNMLLGHFEIKSNASGHNPAKAINARVDVGGAFSILGNVELFSVTYKDGKPENYKIVFYSDVSSLKSEIGNDLLEDIDLTTDFGFTWDGTTVPQSWLGNINSGNIYIPVISWQRWYRWYETPTGHPDDISVSATGITLDELRVGLQLKQLLKTILSEYGYTLTFSDRVSNYFTGAYVFPTKKTDIENLESPFQIQVKNSADLPITITPSTVSMPTEVIDEQDLWTSGTTYTAPFGGEYRFRFLYIIYFLSGYDGIQVTVEAGSQTFYISSSSTFTGGYHDFTLTLAAGETFTISWYDNSGAGSYNATKAELRSIEMPLSPIGQEFLPSTTVPEIRVADFLSGFLKTYNLVLARTGDSSYNIYDYRSLYDTATVLDLSKYADNKVLTYDKMDVYSTVDLKYKEGKDAPNTAFKELVGREYAQYFYRPDVDYSKGEFKRESIFSSFPPGYMGTYNTSDAAVGITDLQHQYQMTDDAPPKIADVDFTVLYQNGIQDTAFTYYMEDGVGTKAEFTTYGQYSQTQDFAALTNSNTLCYVPENTFPGILSENTVFKVFYENWFNDIYSSTAFKVMVKFPADLNLYMKIKQLSKVFLNGFYHNIMEYSYNTQKDEITLLLMKISTSGINAGGDYLQSDYNDDYLK